jgi:hypothetical protein
MSLRKDIWRPAVAHAPIATIAARGSLEGVEFNWLPPMGSFRFLADPFGLWRDEILNIFVERYDYRDRIGTIEVLRMDESFRLIDRRVVLAEPWHLSYPLVFEADGETWMLPEAHRSGRLTLYRAAAFPDRWEPAATIALDAVAVDATPVWQDGLWWLFYAPAGGAMGTLHCAWAERLSGPWTPHPANPVRRDPSGSRPGGTAFVADGRIMLPVQDCSTTYGGAIRMLSIAVTPTRFDAELGSRIEAPASAAPFTEGLHTLAAAGAVTLIDVKRTELSLHGLAIEAARETRKLLGTTPRPSAARRHATSG